MVACIFFVWSIMGYNEDNSAVIKLLAMEVSMSW
jgi:hypothetical protein